MNILSIASSVASVYYIGAGLMMISFMKEQRRAPTLFFHMGILVGVQLFAAGCMVAIHTVDRSPVSAMIWGVILCMCLFSVRQLRRRIKMVRERDKLVGNVARLQRQLDYMLKGIIKN